MQNPQQNKAGASEISPKGIKGILVPHTLEACKSDNSFRLRADQFFFFQNHRAVRSARNPVKEIPKEASCTTGLITALCSMADTRIWSPGFKNPLK